MAERIITGYHITITKAYSIHEQGTGYDLAPWDGDDEYYAGDDESVPVLLAEGVRPGISTIEERLLYRTGEQYGKTLSDAIAAGWATILQPDDPRAADWTGEDVFEALEA